MVCAHKTEAGHQGVTATLARPRPYCILTGIETAVEEFVRQCFALCGFQGWSCDRGLYAELRHGAVDDEVLHFNYLHLTDAGGGDVGSEEMGFAYVRVMIEDVGGDGWLEPMQSLAASATAPALIRWCRFWAPRAWVNDTAINFKNGLMA